MFWALIVSGFYLLGGAAIISANSNFISFLLFKIIPAILGIWLLFEAALVYTAF